MAIYLSNNLNPHYKYIVTILKNRKPFIQTAVKTVIINFLIKIIKRVVLGMNLSLPTKLNTAKIQ